MRSTLVILALTATFGGCVRPTYSLPEPSTLHPEIHTVLSAGTVRLVVYHHCSFEHCYSLPYLQWLSDQPDPAIVATEPVAELHGPSILDDITIDRAGEAVRFRFEVRYDLDRDPYAALLTPGDPGSYRLESPFVE